MSSKEVIACRTFKNLTRVHRDEVALQMEINYIDYRTASYGDCVHLLPHSQYYAVSDGIEARILEAVSARFNIGIERLQELLTEYWASQCLVNTERRT